MNSNFNLANNEFYQEYFDLSDDNGRYLLDMIIFRFSKSKIVHNFTISGDIIFCSRAKEVLFSVNTSAL